PARGRRRRARRRRRAAYRATTSSFRPRSFRPTKRSPTRWTSDAAAEVDCMRRLPNEFLFQLFSLLVIVIVVHAFYVTTVWPNATAVLAEQAIEARANANYSPAPSFWVIIKDYEQESCFVLMF